MASFPNADETLVPSSSAAAAAASASEEVGDPLDIFTDDAHGDWVSLTLETVDVLKAILHVQDPSTGAIATFMGVTRDNFQVN